MNGPVAADGADSSRHDDPVAMMLNYAVVHGLMKTTDIQYLALEWELGIALGLRPRESRMDGKFSPLFGYNRTLMQQSSRSLMHLLRGPHQQQYGGGLGVAVLGKQYLSQVNLFGFADPRNLSRGRLDGAFDGRNCLAFEDVAAFISRCAQGVGPSVVRSNDSVNGRPVSCVLAGYNEDGSALTPALEVNLSSGNIIGLASGQIENEEIDTLLSDARLRRQRLQAPNFAKEVVEGMLTSLDGENSLVRHEYISSRDSGYTRLCVQMNETIVNFRTCACCARHGHDCGGSGYCEACMANRELCEACELDGEVQWLYGLRHCRQPCCTGTCERLCVLEVTFDHAPNQQKYLQMLSSGADSEIIVAKTREIVPFGDPSHTLKLWRSGLYWWYLSLLDLSGNPWLVTISILWVFLEQKNEVSRAAAYEAGVRYSFLRNRDRMSVETIVVMCKLSAWLLGLNEKLVVYTIYPERSVWKTNKGGMILRPRSLAAVECFSSVYVLDSERHRIFALRLHQPVDILSITSGGEGFADGLGSFAKFSSPACVSSLGTVLLVADSGNDAIRIIDLGKKAPPALQAYQIERKGKSKGQLSVCVGTIALSGKPDHLAAMTRPISICSFVTGETGAFVATEAHVFYMFDLAASRTGNEITSAAKLIKIFDISTSFFPILGICDCGDRGSGRELILCAKGLVVHLVVIGLGSEKGEDLIVSTFTISTTLVSPCSPVIWAGLKKGIVALADSSTGQIFRLYLRSKKLVPWVGQVLGPSSSASSSDGTLQNATFLKPTGLCTFGFSILVSEYNKVRIITSVEPLGRALQNMNSLINVLGIVLKKGRKEAGGSLSDTAEVIKNMNAFILESSAASACRLGSSSYSHQGPSLCWSAVVQKSAALSEKSIRTLAGILRAVPECTFLEDGTMHHLTAQDRTEGNFGCQKGGANAMPTMLEYELKRVPTLEEAAKKWDARRGFHYSLGRASYYPTRLEESATEGATRDRPPTQPHTVRRSAEENAARVAKALDFKRQHGQRVRQSGVRARSKEFTGTLPHDVDYARRREASDPGGLPPEDSSNGSGSGSSGGSSSTGTGDPGDSMPLIFRSGTVVLLWKGEDENPPYELALIQGDVFELLNNSVSAKRRKNPLFGPQVYPEVTPLTWLDDSHDEDGNLTLVLGSEDDEGLSSDIMSALLRDESIVAVHGVQESPQSGAWNVSLDDMEYSRRMLLGDDDGTDSADMSEDECGDESEEVVEHDED